MQTTASPALSIRRLGRAAALAVGLAALVLPAGAAAETPAGAGISIATYGPATAAAGELLTYTFAVADSGGTSFAAADVLVVGSACQSAATIVNHGADLSTATLDPGDTWTYQCQVQTAPGTPALVMSGRAAATDGSGAAVSAAASFTTPLSAARGGVAGLHVHSGSARVSASSSCARGSASALVTGSRIGHATFFVDGRLVHRALRPDARGRFVLHLRTRRMSARLHVVRVHVVFEVGSHTASRTLDLHVRGCAGS
jgi:hypothetical protein